MSNIWAVILVFVCGFVSASASASEGYLCIADKATGFKLDADRQQWQNVNFTADRKYVISQRTDKVNKQYTWEVKEVGDSTPSFLCEDFSHDVLHCEGLSAFHMNKKKLRYSRGDLLGYIYDPNPLVNTNMVSIEIGKCSPL